MSQTILVTGVAGGFGRLIANALSLQGHRVVGTLREAQGRNAAHAQHLQTGGVTVMEMDVS